LQVVIDIETDKLDNPSKVWVIVCKDIDTGELYVFRNVSEEPSEQRRFAEFSERVSLWVGHNWLEFDYPVLARCCGLSIREVWCKSLDTLVLSRLFNYSEPHSYPAGLDARALHSSSDPGGKEASDALGSAPSPRTSSIRKSHSIDSYGEEFGIPKLKFNDFSKFSLEMETYCKRDVEIAELIYHKYSPFINDPKWKPSIELEQHFQFSVINDLQDNGFAFNKSKAEKLLDKVTIELGELDAKIREVFKPKLTLIREVHPRITSHGTLHKGDFRFVKGGNLSEYNGYPFSRCEWVEFNPASHRQVINILHEAKWSPVDKTQAYIEAERSREPIPLDKLEHLSKYGWKINENNLSTLPLGAPSPAKFLAKRILLESRRRTLREWISLVKDDGRIHGHFIGIGAWTGRMAHQKPNTANIPNDLDTQGKKKLLGKELRSLWMAPKNRLLVGVDAEGIQLRIFAHLINDPEFTEALVKGKKDDKTDPHSLNQRILGSICKSRAAAKRFIYALLLGAGMWKLSQVLDCSEPECQEALNRLLRRYTGFARLKETVIPKDAKRGYLIGLDGRKVQIPGDSVGERKHLAMSGYLQSGEAVVMKLATLKWMKELEDAKEMSNGSTIQTTLPASRPIIVNFVHDEWQTETPNNIKTALWVAECQSRALREVGEDLKLNCPLAGSYWNDDIKDYTIGTNWSVTH